MEEFKFLRVLFTSEGKAVCTDALSVPMSRGEGEAKPKGEPRLLQFGLRIRPHLWSQALGNGQKNKIADTRRTQRLPGEVRKTLSGAEALKGQCTLGWPGNASESQWMNWRR